MNDSSMPVTAPAPVPVAETRPPPKETFFSRRDKLACAIAAAISFAFYFYTLAPSVTLEDSGEFITAGHHLGVPHPPGYPTWTIMAWLWQYLFPIGNIAWRLNVMSTVFSAAAVGLAALLISKSGHVMAARVGFLHETGHERLVDMIILASSVSAALMLAFSPVMWSQGVIAEVYGPNAF